MWARRGNAVTLVDVNDGEAGRRRSTAAVSKEAISFDPFGISLAAS